MAEHPQCDADIYEPHTETTQRCANTAAARITEDGETRYYCRGHAKLTQEFLTQARRNAIRWNAVIQIAETPR